MTDDDEQQAEARAEAARWELGRLDREVERVSLSLERDRSRPRARSSGDRATRYAPAACPSPADGRLGFSAPF